MKILLIVVLVIVSLLILNFIFWYIVAMVTDKKRTASYTKHLVNSLPLLTRIHLIIILKAYKKEDVEKVNGLVQKMESSDVESLVKMLHPSNRSPEFSAGKFGNELSWTVWLNSLSDAGYSENASKILACCFLNSLGKVLVSQEEEK